MDSLSIVIPAKNESCSISEVISGVKEVFSEAEIIVVNDGSDDETEALARDAGARVISHPYSKGNGAAIKAGARAAKGDLIVFMDGDGQHRPKDISRLLEKMALGYDMVVGARGAGSQASKGRWAANTIYNKLAGWMVGQPIADLTSGFRVVKRKKFLQFVYMLPNGFSYPTTSTMAFFRTGYSVGYLDIVADERQGSSHISIWKDGIRFLLIIFKVGTLYSPLKLFLPISICLFLLGMLHYVSTYLSMERFTNMSALLLTASVIVFLMGLISEQINNLQYSSSNKKE